MGNICGGPNKTSLETASKRAKKPTEKKESNEELLTIYGDYFQSETRSILAILDFCGIKYNFNELDIFQGEHESDSYLELNPTGQLPTIKESSILLIGGFLTQLEYLMHY